MPDDRTDADLTAEDDAADVALLADLRMLAVIVDPVPPDAVAAARAAIAWRTVDAELAELIAETSLEPQLAGVRGGGAPVMLTFEAPGLTLEVEVTDDRPSPRLLGQVVPPGPADVEIRHGGGRTALVADEIGRFAVPAVVPGPVSITCRRGAQVIETDWFLA